jgi:hypothetical protein
MVETYCNLYGKGSEWVGCWIVLRLKVGHFMVLDCDCLRLHSMRKLVRIHPCAVIGGD